MYGLQWWGPQNSHSVSLFHASTPEMRVGSRLSIHQKTGSEEGWKQTSCALQPMCTTYYKSDVLLNDWDEYCNISLGNLHHEGSPCNPLYPSEHPVAFLPPPTIVLSLSKFAFVYFNFNPQTFNCHGYLCLLTILHSAPHTHVCCDGSSFFCLHH